MLRGHSGDSLHTLLPCYDYRSLGIVIYVRKTTAFRVEKGSCLIFWPSHTSPSSFGGRSDHVLTFELPRLLLWLCCLAKQLLLHHMSWHDDSLI